MHTPVTEIYLLTLVELSEWTEAVIEYCKKQKK